MVSGARLGTKLGFPTANVRLKRRSSPLKGIFAVRVQGLAEGPLNGVALGGRVHLASGPRKLKLQQVKVIHTVVRGNYLCTNYL